MTDNFAANNPIPKPDSTPTKASLAQIAAEVLCVPVDKILPIKSLAELGIQSIDIVELICAIEDRYNIHIDYTEANEILDLDQAVIYLQNKIAKSWG